MNLWGAEGSNGGAEEWICVIKIYVERQIYIHTHLYVYVCIIRVYVYIKI